MAVAPHPEREIVARPTTLRAVCPWNPSLNQMERPERQRHRKVQDDRQEGAAALRNGRPEGARRPSVARHARRNPPRRCGAHTGRSRRMPSSKFYSTNAERARRTCDRYLIRLPPLRRQLHLHLVRSGCPCRRIADLRETARRHGIRAHLEPGRPAKRIQFRAQGGRSLVLRCSADTRPIAPRHAPCASDDMLARSMPSSQTPVTSSGGAACSQMHFSTTPGEIEPSGRDTPSSARSLQPPWCRAASPRAWGPACTRRPSGLPAARTTAATGRQLRPGWPRPTVWSIQTVESWSLANLHHPERS